MFDMLPISRGVLGNQGAGYRIQHTAAIADQTSKETYIYTFAVTISAGGIENHNTIIQKKNTHTQECLYFQHMSTNI